MCYTLPCSDIPPWRRTGAHTLMITYVLEVRQLPTPELIDSCLFNFFIAFRLAFAYTHLGNFDIKQSYLLITLPHPFNRANHPIGLPFHKKNSPSGRWAASYFYYQIGRDYH
jgi:hypothetical protein